MSVEAVAWESLIMRRKTKARSKEPRSFLSREWLQKREVYSRAKAPWGILELHSFNWSSKTNGGNFSPFCAGSNFASFICLEETGTIFDWCPSCAWFQKIPVRIVRVPLYAIQKGFHRSHGFLIVRASNWNGSHFQKDSQDLGMIVVNSVPIPGIVFLGQIFLFETGSPLVAVTNKWISLMFPVTVTVRDMAA